MVVSGRATRSPMEILATSYHPWICKARVAKAANFTVCRRQKSIRDMINTCRGSVTKCILASIEIRKLHETAGVCSELEALIRDSG